MPGWMDFKMRQVVAGESDQGRGLVRFLCVRFPALTPGAVYKALRKKDIRIDGRRVSADCALSPGEVVSVYLPDDILGVGTAEPDPVETDAATAAKPSTAPSIVIPVVYRGPDLLIVDKPQGIAVHTGAGIREGALVDLLRERLQDDSLTLCHRIDLGTGGLVMLAFGPESLGAALDVMKRGLLTKRYRCLVRGRWDAPGSASDGFCTREAWLEKPKGGGRVYIHDSDAPGRVSVVTRIRNLRLFPDAGPDGEPVSELEIELGTGRTHQIRAHLAYLGHPVLGDGMYGRNAYNRHFRDVDGGRIVRQQLFATCLAFGKIEKNHRLAYLANRRFEIDPGYSVAFGGTPPMEINGRTTPAGP